MVRPLKANSPIVVKAAKERARILAELGLPLDERTARIAELTPDRDAQPVQSPAEPHKVTADDFILSLEAIQKASAEAAEENWTKVAVGDCVIYSKYGGTELRTGGHEYLVLSARDVLAVASATSALKDKAQDSHAPPRDWRAEQDQPSEAAVHGRHTSGS